MVLAELACCITQRLQRLGDGNIARLEAYRSARNANFRQPGALRRLPGDEGGATRRATVLGVIVSEHHAFAGNSVDVWRFVAEDAECIGADVCLPDIVTEDNEDIGLVTGCRRPRNWS